MKYKIILTISLVLVVVFLITTIVLAMNYVPQIAENVFGPADPKLDFSQRFLYSVRLLAYQNQLLGIVDQAGQMKEIEITPGETADQVSRKLFEEGIILNPDAFRLFLAYSGLDIRIRAGHYELHPANNSIEIARLICDLSPNIVRFIILPGMRAEEIAALIPTSGLSFKTEEFLRLVRNPDALSLKNEIKGVKSLEGYLFPGEYLFNRNTTVEDFINELISRFLENVTPDLINGLRANGLVLNQGVILASIIQREIVLLEEGPTIASVFYNRLSRGMMLQSDPTVQYAIGNQSGSWWKVPLVTNDFQVSSPYNTYLNIGLPPTPICNPGLDSLEAAAFPRKTNYYFFQSMCDNSGRHNFFETYEEHRSNLCK